MAGAAQMMMLGALRWRSSRALKGMGGAPKIEPVIKKSLFLVKRESYNIYTERRRKKVEGRSQKMKAKGRFRTGSRYRG
jgi:hypothetical protein